MRILGMMVMMMFFAVGAASAVTVNLTNGNAVQGDIVKQDSKSLQINVDGVAMTYYADEIKDVDGKPFAAEQTKPVAPAPFLQRVQSLRRLPCHREGLQHLQVYALKTRRRDL